MTHKSISRVQGSSHVRNHLHSSSQRLKNKKSEPQADQSPPFHELFTHIKELVRLTWETSTFEKGSANCLGKTTILALHEKGDCFVKLLV